MDPLELEIPPALRELTSADAPFPGVLRAGEPPVVWTDAAGFGASPAWRAVDAEHVLAPLDATVTPDGARVLLPHCPIRLEDALDGSLGPGPAVTVAVSALRGATEADRLHAERGEWWVTSEGKPVLALIGSREWRADTVALLRALAETADAPLSGPLDRAAETVADPRLLRREGAALEDDLFRAAAAEALPTQLCTTTPAAAPSRRTEGPATAAGGALGETVRDLVARLVDGEVADRLRAAVRGLRARRPSAERPSSPPRRRVALVAVAAAVSVVLLGALWPHDGGDPASPVVSGRDAAAATPTEAPAADRRGGAGAKNRPASESPPASRAADVGPPELVSAARDLIDAASACEAAACLDRVWETPASAGPIDAARADYRVEVVDEYGGVAAIRVTGPDVTQIVVIVAAEKRWLVREVYDLADQP